MTPIPTAARATALTRPAPHAPAPHPIVFTILYLPTGLALGYIGALGWLLTRAGASVEQVAALAAMPVLANTWRVVFAPLVDTTLSARTWFRLSVTAQAAILAALALLPLKTELLGLFTALCLASGVAGGASNMAVERFMALSTPPDAKGRAAGWNQAGALGGASIAGGGGIWLMQHVGHPWLAGAILALLCLAAQLPALWLEDPRRPPRTRGYVADLIDTFRDALSLIRTRQGFLASLLLVLPIGSGGLLWPALAKSWNAGPDEVALITGLLTGLINFPAPVLGGWLCDRLDKKTAYALFGLALAAVALLAAAAPRTPATYMLAACAYTAAAGLACGGFVAVILEAVDRGAVATKFNLLLSLCNLPILLATLVDGWAATHLGPTGMLLTDAALGIAGLCVYAAIARLTRRPAT